MYREYFVIEIASNKEGKRGAIDSVSRWGQFFFLRGLKNKERTDNLDPL